MWKNLAGSDTFDNTLFAWVRKDSLASIKTSRNLYSFTQLWMEFWPMLQNESVILCSRVRNIMNSVLSKLIVNLFLIDRLFNDSSTLLHFDDRLPMSKSDIATVVSSTNSVKFPRLGNDGRSLTYTRNNNGPYILPWGSPNDKFFFSFELLPFRFTYCFLFDK